MARKSTVLRRQLESGEMVVAPGCYECVSARVIEKVGFKAAYMTGWGTEATHGFPDIGLLSATEVTTHANRIATSISIPLICDSDTGYGSALNVWRTVQDFVRADVAGIHIEDQMTPKKCGGLTGRVVVPIEEAVGKYKAAIAARDELDSDMLIIARTDSKYLGLDEVIKRLNTYLKAGADAGMVAEFYTEDEFRKVVKAVKGPMLICYSDPDPTRPDYPHLSIKDYKDMGVRILIFPTTSIRAAMRTYIDLWEDVKKQGTITKEMGRRLYPSGDAFDLVGLPEWSKREITYIPGAEEIVPSKVELRTKK